MVKVIIERRCQPGNLERLESQLLSLRAGAMRQRGYVYGETMRSVDVPTLLLVISVWLDADLWRAWECSPERQELARKVEPLLMAPEKATVFSFVWDACWWPPEPGPWE